MTLRILAKTASFSILAFGLVTAANASISLVSTGADWAADTTGPNNSGNYFWNNTSSDGSTCNIGYFLLKGASGCGNVANLQAGCTGLGTNLDFLSGSINGSTSAPGFGFIGTGISSLLVTITGNANEAVGYTDSTGDHILAAKGGSTTTATITPTGPFDFFLSINGVNTYNTEANSNQFALFAPGVTTGAASGSNAILNSFYLGAEDTAVTGGDKDFNDVVIEVTATPEPGFYGALAVGFSGLVLAVKRRRKA